MYLYVCVGVLISKCMIYNYFEVIDFLLSFDFICDRYHFFKFSNTYNIRTSLY